MLIMDESDPNESNNETNNYSNGSFETDNKLAQYMLINKELSKTMVVLKAENAKLRNYNKELSLQNLTFHNEIIKNRNELAKWRKKFTKLQTLHIHHIETLTGELQSYTDKIAYVFGVEDVDCEPEDTSRVTEQQSTVVNSPSISEDALPQGSKVLETQMPQNAIPEQIDENPSNLNTINEESEEESEASTSEQISLNISSNESTAETTTISEADGTTSIIARRSVSDAHEMASMDSNKENERPSTFNDSNLTLTNKDNPSTFNGSSLTLTNGGRLSTFNGSNLTLTNGGRLSTFNGSNLTLIKKDNPSTFNGSNSILTNEERKSSVRSSESLVQQHGKTISSVKENFVTKRRKLTVEPHSFENPSTPEFFSSTPYKRKRNDTSSGRPSKVDVENTITSSLSDSVRMTRRSAMSISSTGRPKRNACPLNFTEPKLNTKMRRPRT